MSPIAKGVVSALLLTLVAILTTSCQSGYVIRQAFGQLSLSRRQLPLADAAKLEGLSDSQRANLELVPEVLSFARERLGLDTGDAYTTFVDTGNAPVSTTVSAAHPYSLSPYLWSFPFVGRVSYKGYFDSADAKAEAERLQTRGYETVLSSVSAYSTLGWFRDPVLSTMLDLEMADLVDLLIHECTHRTLYFANSTSINESLATHIAFAGTLLFLEQKGVEESVIARYRRGHATARRREELITRLRRDLEGLYASRVPEPLKQARKTELFQTARAAFEVLEEDGRRFPSSNAHLLATATYHRHRPLFEALQTALGGDPRTLLEDLQRLPRSESLLADLEQRLDSLRSESTETPTTGGAVSARPAP